MKSNGIKLNVSYSMKKSLILILIYCSFVGNVSAQYKKEDEHIWNIIKKDLDRTQSVYISDSSVYCQVLSFMADSNKQQLANKCETYLLDYGNRDLIKKYARYYKIPWQRYPLFLALSTDTLQPNPQYPLWVNAMLGDTTTIDYLITKFMESSDFSEKIYYIDCLSRRNDNAVLSMLIEEYRKDIYYYDRHNYECYSSKYFLVYWLRHIFSENPLFQKLYNENIQNIYVYYMSTNNADDMTNIISNDDISVVDFIKRNGNNNQKQYIKRVESFVNETYGVNIYSEEVKLIWFYYVTEIE